MLWRIQIIDVCGHLPTSVSSLHFYEFLQQRILRDNSSEIFLGFQSNGGISHMTVEISLIIYS